MSFSTEVKNELSRLFPPTYEEQLAELSAMMRMSGSLQLKGSNKIAFQITTENPAVARKLFFLSKQLFGIKPEIQVRQNQSFKRKIYFILISSNTGAEHILKETQILQTDGIHHYYSSKLPAFLRKNDASKRAYIRGAFLGSGSISHPEKLYHMEFVSLDHEISHRLKNLLNSFGFGAKIVDRKGNRVIYLKDSEHISDLLAFIGAHQALLELENIKIQKQMKNAVNRLVNCETANLNKTVDAAIRQIEAIKFISNTRSLEYLPEDLRELALLRLDSPDLSLKELGEKMTIPLGKSGVNHRLKQIETIAKQLREEIF